MTNSTSGEREQQLKQAPETIYFATEDINCLTDCLPVTPFIEPMRGQCVSYLRESTERPKLLSDSEWKSLSAESRFNITAYLARQERTTISMRDLCVREVKEYLTDCRDEERAIIEAIASQLQSLTLEQEQK